MLAAFSVSDRPELGDEARSANTSSNKELSSRCGPRAQIQGAGVWWEVGWLEQVAAGLSPQAAGFGVMWPSPY